MPGPGLLPAVCLLVLLGRADGLWELWPSCGFQLSTAKPGRTGNMGEDVRNCTSHMGILWAHKIRLPDYMLSCNLS